jgi:hypothetical protein
MEEDRMGGMGFQRSRKRRRKGEWTKMNDEKERG